MNKFENEDKILIKDFEVLACHGVNPSEKTTPQRFLISAKLTEDMSISAQNDDLNQTTSYSAVKKIIQKFVMDNCFDLIETLATRLCELVLTSFPLISSAKIKVKKPDAPMSGVFDYVGVSVEKAWHTVYLSLGSNLGDKNGYLNFAIDCLRADAKIKEIKESSRVCSAPYGGVATCEFLNSIVEIRTLYTPFELLKCLKRIEEGGDRIHEIHWGNRTLDIDIIFYDDIALSQRDLCIPHADMQNRYFVLQPLAELNPNLLHPVMHKRVFEMLAELKCQKSTLHLC